MVKKLTDWLKEVATVDLRSLAFMRMAFGLLLILDLAIRLPDYQTFYTNSGVLPVRFMSSLHYVGKHYYCYRLFDVGWWTLLLFLFSFLSAIALTIGYRTRIFTALSWFLFASLHSRNSYLLDIGDVYMRIIMLWSIFLPLGARYSWDAYRNPTWANLPNRFCSLATGGYVLQICTVYLVAGILKSDPLWTTTGDALFMALSIDQFASELAQALTKFPNFLRPFNFAALYLELGAAFLICCPKIQNWTRGLAVFLLASFHIAIAFCLHLGLLVPMCIAILLGLVPSPVIDWLEPKLCALLDIQLPASPDSPAALPPAYRLPRPAKALMSILMVYTVAQNAVGIPQLNFPLNLKILLPVSNFGLFFGIQQNWQLFAPYPFREDGWYIVEGIKADGSSIDLLNDGKPMSLVKPKLVSAQFKNQRWRRYYQNLWKRNNPRLIPHYCKWELVRWNKTHTGSESLKSVRLLFVQEWTELPGVPLTLKTYIYGTYPSPDYPDTEDDNCTEECHCDVHVH